jgi:hypothetical protein
VNRYRRDRASTAPIKSFRILTPDEITQLLLALPNDPARLLVDTFIGTGLRWGEAADESHQCVRGLWSAMLTPGQAGDAPMMLPVLAASRVERALGRPRTRPDGVLADKANSSRAIRAHLRAGGIASVIPEPDDQKAHRKQGGAVGGRPVTYHRAPTEAATSSSVPSTTSNAGAVW